MVLLHFQEQIITQHSVTSQKNCTFSNNAVTTLNLTIHLHVHVNIMHLFWTELHHVFNITYICHCT